MISKKDVIKIAQQLYTYLKDADEDEQVEQIITFKQIKSDIIGKQDDLVSAELKKLSEQLDENSLIQFINQKDNKGYTLLMLASSNGLQKTVEQLIILGADTTITLTVRGDLFRKILKHRLNTNQIDQQEYAEQKSIGSMDIMAIDIAQVKRHKNIVKLLK